MIEEEEDLKLATRVELREAPTEEALLSEADPMLEEDGTSAPTTTTARGFAESYFNTKTLLSTEGMATYLEGHPAFNFDGVSVPLRGELWPEFQRCMLDGRTFVPDGEDALNGNGCSLDYANVGLYWLMSRFDEDVRGVPKPSFLIEYMNVLTDFNTALTDFVMDQYDAHPEAWDPDTDWGSLKFVYEEDSPGEIKIKRFNAPFGTGAHSPSGMVQRAMQLAGGPDTPRRRTWTW